MNAIIAIEQRSEFATNPTDTRWVSIFDPYAAVKAVFTHIEKLASSRTSRHTARQYRICLYDFLEYCGAVIDRDQSDKTRMDGDYFDFRAMQLHTPTQMDEYIIYCLENERDSKTIGKYLAPIRHYLNALRRQPFIGLQGDIRYLILDAKEMFELAALVDAPPAKKESGEPTGIRLSKAQVMEYNRNIDRATLAGKRDAAMTHVMLVACLRVSELARLRLCDIYMGKNSWEIKVIGKRNNTDPVGFDQEGVDLIMDYVNTYNEGLPEADPRRITRETPVWQPLRCNSTYVALDETWFDPQAGITADSIRKIVKRRTPARLIEEIGKSMHPHDWRRTTAESLDENGAPLTGIQRQLRHASPTTTSNYIGKRTNLRRGLITNYWSDLWAA